MPQQQPPVLKWNPYKIGETRTQITKELNQLVAKKEYRRKVGLDLGVYREFKGNTHWNLFITIQLTELLLKRMNEDMKSIFIQNAQLINSTGAYINNVIQHLKKAEYNISNAATLSGNNVVKMVKGEMAKLTKMTSGLSSLKKNLLEKTQEIQNELDNTQNILNQAVTDGFKESIKEINENTDSAKTTIQNNLKDFKDFDSERFNELNAQLVGLNEKLVQTLENQSEQLNGKLDGVSTNVGDISERVGNFHEAMNNVLDDSQRAIVNEFQEGVGALMKLNSENLDAMKINGAEVSEQIINQIENSTENLTTVLDATNEHIDKVNENMDVSVKNVESEISKQIDTEITDVRAILSSIRSDIELMKSVLTKLDNK